MRSRAGVGSDGVPGSRLTPLTARVTMAHVIPSEAAPRTESLEERLAQARREARLTEAAWRMKRAEVARLVAAGEQAEALRIVRAIERTTAQGAKTPVAETPAATTLPATAPKSPAAKATARKATAGKATAPSPPEPRAVAPLPPAAHTGPSASASQAALRRKRTSTEPSAPPAVRPSRRVPAADGGAAVRPARVRRHAQPAVAKGSPSSAPSSPPSSPPPREAIRLRNRLAQGTVAAWRDWLSRRPPWALSLTAHVGLLLALALLSFAAWREPPFVLTATLNAAEPAWEAVADEQALAEFTAEIPHDAEAVETSVELVSLSEPLASALPLERVAVTDLGDLLATASTGLLQEVGPAEGKNEAASSQRASSPPGNDRSAGGVRFFGSEAVADRVAFVVDNSGSMQRGRLETTLAELDNAIKRLSHSQSFYVVLFSDQAYPMFYPEPVNELLPATRQNQDRLSRWLGTVEMCIGGRLLDAVELAAAVKPQVVYLLSDGEIHSQFVMSKLTDPHAWDFTIHTIGMGNHAPEDVAKLQAIAAANDGVFRGVDAHPAAMRLSLTNPRPYHRTPGKVWGTLVQSWQN